MYNRFGFKHRFRCWQSKIIPSILIIGGVFLVITFTPIWMWVIILGLFLIYSGYHIMKKWR